eukprot:jgi/Ulvmu1/8538/UM044_0072.1
MNTSAASTSSHVCDPPATVYGRPALLALRARSVTIALAGKSAWPTCCAVLCCLFRATLALAYAVNPGAAAAAVDNSGGAGRGPCKTVQHQGREQREDAARAAMFARPHA